MTDKPTPTDAATPEPLSKRPSEANTLVWVADPISSTGVRGVFVDDITCLWWWGAGLIFQKEADAAALALRMRSAIASRGQAPAGATEMENLQRTAVGWQGRALRAERNWAVCRSWAIAGGAPVEKLGDDPNQPFHAASPAIDATRKQGENHDR